MKAIRVTSFGAPEVLTLSDVDTPKPESGQVTVRLHAAGVNPVETYIRSGSYAKLPELPYTPGSDGAGVIEEVGTGVTDFEKGQRVWLSGSISGTYAEVALCAQDHVHPLGEMISFSQGAAIGVAYLTAWRALIQAGRAKPGESVLIHGATGGVGLATLQMARNLGMTVLTTGGSEEGRQLLYDQGADVIMDHHTPDYDKQILEKTHGVGVNLIIEMLANMNLAKDTTMLARFGRIIVIGSRGPVEINARELMIRDAEIRGVLGGNMRPEERTSALAGMQAGFANGTLAPVVDEEIPLSEAARAHESIMSGSHCGKIVLSM